ncbi:hypothetical protein L208DRAFT_1271005, partial [Tricholoma matsutake]
PEDELHPSVEYYWHLGFSDKVIVEHVLDHFDKSKYGFSLKSLGRVRASLGLKGTRQQKAAFETISPFIQEICAHFPTMGAHQMVTTLHQDYFLKVSELMVPKYLKKMEPQAVALRKQKQFRWKWFWAAGVMDILACNQHNKWKHFGLWLYVGLDPYCGHLAWLKIWWCNRNPWLIAGYYIEAGHNVGGIPLITQSDCGGENNVVANCHTVICHRLDPSLAGTLQHRWCVEKSNIKPEALWSQLWCQFTPGFETQLDYGLNNSLYNPDDPLEKLVFRWLAIPWLQAELNAWMCRFNSSPCQADKHKLLPQGIPDIIHAKPHLFGSKDFKVVISPKLFDEMEQEWAPPSDPVFQLVPVTFAEQATMLYHALGQPAVSCITFWTVYQELLAAFLRLPADPQLAEALLMADEGVEVEVPVLTGLRELQHGDNVVGEHGYMYCGGLENPPPIDEEEEGPGNVDLREFADFSD